MIAEIDFNFINDDGLFPVRLSHTKGPLIVGETITLIDFSDGTAVLGTIESLFYEPDGALVRPDWSTVVDDFEQHQAPEHIPPAAVPLTDSESLGALAHSG